MSVPAPPSIRSSPRPPWKTSFWKSAERPVVAVAELDDAAERCPVGPVIEVVSAPEIEKKGSGKGRRDLERAGVHDPVVPGPALDRLIRRLDRPGVRQLQRTCPDDFDPLGAADRSEVRDRADTAAPAKTIPVLVDVRSLIRPLLKTLLPAPSSLRAEPAPLTVASELIVIDWVLVARKPILSLRLSPSR